MVITHHQPSWETAQLDFLPFSHRARPQGAAPAALCLEGARRTSNRKTAPARTSLQLLYQGTPRKKGRAALTPTHPAACPWKGPRGLQKTQWHSCSSCLQQGQCPTLPITGRGAGTNHCCKVKLPSKCSPACTLDCCAPKPELRHRNVTCRY